MESYAQVTELTVNTNLARPSLIHEMYQWIFVSPGVLLCTTLFKMRERERYIVGNKRGRERERECVCIHVFAGDQIRGQRSSQAVNSFSPALHYAADRKKTNASEEQGGLTRPAPSCYIVYKVVLIFWNY